MPTGLRSSTGAALRTASVATLSRPVTRTAVQRDHQSRGFAAYEGSPNGGQALVALPLPQTDEHYLVEVITLSSTSSNATTAGLYVGVPGDPLNLVDYTPNGALAVAYEVPAILVPPGQAFSILWSGLSGGAVCTARVQWRIMANLTTGGAA